MTWHIQKTKEYLSGDKTVNMYIGSHGSMIITLEVPASCNRVHWLADAVRSEGGIVFIDYTPPNTDKEQTMEFELDINQVFSIQSGQNFFQIETNGRKETFHYLRNGTFIPNEKHLRKCVTVNERLQDQ